jgi:hypothetical protein
MNIKDILFVFAFIFILIGFVLNTLSMSITNIDKMCPKEDLTIPKCQGYVSLYFINLASAFALLVIVLVYIFNIVQQKCYRTSCSVVNNEFNSKKWLVGLFISLLFVIMITNFLIKFLYINDENIYDNDVMIRTISSISYFIGCVLFFIYIVSINI